MSDIKNINSYFCLLLFSSIAELNCYPPPALIGQIFYQPKKLQVHSAMPDQVKSTQWRGLWSLVWAQTNTKTQTETL